MYAHMLADKTDQIPFYLSSIHPHTVFSPKESCFVAVFTQPEHEVVEGADELSYVLQFQQSLVHEVPHDVSLYFNKTLLGGHMSQGWLTEHLYECGRGWGMVCVGTTAVLIHS